MKLRVCRKDRDVIIPDRRWIVRTGNDEYTRSFTVGAKHITEEQAADINIDELSHIRACLGSDFAIEIVL